MRDRNPSRRGLGSRPREVAQEETLLPNLPWLPIKPCTS